MYAVYANKLTKSADKRHKLTAKTDKRLTKKIFIINKVLSEKLN